jgi:hypothetical protein
MRAADSPIRASLAPAIVPVSTLALDGSEAPSGSRRLASLRYLDLAVLAIALPVFIVGGLPLAGYAAVTGAWLLQRVVQASAERQAGRALADGVRKNAVGLLAGAVLVRLWIVTLAILLVGLLGDREDGLAAAILAFVLVTCSLGSRALSQFLETPESPA